jgi:hypothetical protein
MLGGRRRSNGATDFRALLVGGDRRSIAQSNRALARVRERPVLVAEVARLTQDRDGLVAMRALDLLEKLAHEHPAWVTPHKAILLGGLADSDRWELRLQIVRALPLFEWSKSERKRAVEILLRDVQHQQKFVRAWALDSLAAFALRDADLMPIVRRLLSRFASSGSKALMVRARRIEERLRPGSPP